jgi:hypothetical protein
MKRGPQEPGSIKINHKHWFSANGGKQKNQKNHGSRKAVSWPGSGAVDLFVAGNFP